MPTELMPWPTGQVYRFRASNLPLTMLDIEGDVWLHRGDCHRGQGNRPVLPEWMLRVLWDGERVAMFEGKPRRVHFCDNIATEVPVTQVA